MTLSTPDLPCSDAAVKAPRMADQTQQAPKSFPLLRLPLELRRDIYIRYLFIYRSPTPEVIYLQRKPLQSKDPPSPLLLVSSQVRAEVLDTVQTKPISLRVTHHGIQFDSLAETCFIAQKRSRDYASMPRLFITIWLPHPDRPIDLIAIWRHLRKLRRELRDAPSLQRVDFLLENNKMAGWTDKGEPLRLLGFSHYGDLPFNDLTCIMDLFSRVRAAKAIWCLPFGLRCGETTDDIRSWRNSYQAMVMGRIPVDEEAYREENEEESSRQDAIDDYTASKLQWKNTQIARDKLDAMTERMSWLEWQDFIELWSPDFGIAFDFDEDDYVDTAETISEDEYAGSEASERRIERRMKKYWQNKI